MPHCPALQLGLLTLTLLLAGAEAKRSRSRSPYNDDFSDVITSDNSGLFIWRIEDFSPVPLSETKYGTFHNADSYIVLLSKLVDGRMHRGGSSECELVCKQRLTISIHAFKEIVQRCSLIDGHF